MKDKNIIEELKQGIEISQQTIMLHLMDKIDEAVSKNDQDAVEFWMLRYHHYLIMHGIGK